MAAIAAIRAAIGKGSAGRSLRGHLSGRQLWHRGLSQSPGAMFSSCSLFPRQEHGKVSLPVVGGADPDPGIVSDLLLIDRRPISDGYILHRHRDMALPATQDAAGLPVQGLCQTLLGLLVPAGEHLYRNMGHRPTAGTAGPAPDPPGCPTPARWPTMWPGCW